SLIVKTSEKHDPVPIRPNASRSIPHLNLVFGQSPVNVVQPGLLTGSQKCVRNTVLTYFHLYGSVLIGISQIKKVIIPVIVLLPSSIYFNQRRFRYCRYCKNCGNRSRREAKYSATSAMEFSAAAFVREC